LRRPRRLSVEDFKALERRAATALATRPGDRRLLALAGFSAGGLAWAQGDDRAAHAATARIGRDLASDDIASHLVTWIADIGSTREPADWQLAVLYGDARGDGLQLVEAHLAREPADTRARLAQAVLLHIHGRHAEAEAAASALSAAVPAEDAEASSHLHRFIGDERAELGQWRGALEAYRRAASTRGRVAVDAALEGARVALEQLGDEDAAAEFYAAACAAGSELACRRAALIENGPASPPSL